MIFLLEYDRAQGKLLSLQAFGDNSKAQEMRFNMEIQTGSYNVEIVILEADSEEDLKKTHGRYFIQLAKL